MLEIGEAMTKLAPSVALADEDDGNEVDDDDDD